MRLPTERRVQISALSVFVRRKSANHRRRHALLRSLRRVSLEMEELGESPCLERVHPNYVR